MDFLWAISTRAQERVDSIFIQHVDMWFLELGYKVQRIKLYLIELFLHSLSRSKDVVKNRGRFWIAYIFF